MGLHPFCPIHIAVAVDITFVDFASEQRPIDAAEMMYLFPVGAPKLVRGPRESVPPDQGSHVSSLREVRLHA